MLIYVYYLYIQNFSIKYILYMLIKIKTGVLLVFACITS